MLSFAPLLRMYAPVLLTLLHLLAVSGAQLDRHTCGGHRHRRLRHAHVRPLLQQAVLACYMRPWYTSYVVVESYEGRI